MGGRKKGRGKGEEGRKEGAREGKRAGGGERKCRRKGSEEVRSSPSILSGLAWDDRETWDILAWDN